MALGGVAVAGLGASRSLPVIAALAAVYLAGESVGGICSMSLRQEVTPDHLLGRVTSAFWVTHFSLGPVGAVLLAWGAGRYGVAPVCVAAGAGCVLIAAIALFTPVRQRAGRDGAASRRRLNGSTRLFTPVRPAKGED